MQSYTIELVSNASAQLFPDKTLSSLQTFNQSNWICKVNGRLLIRKYPTHQCTKLLRQENLYFFDKKLLKNSEFFFVEPGLYSSFIDIVENMNTLIQEKHNHSEKCILVKVS